MDYVDEPIHYLILYYMNEDNSNEINWYNKIWREISSYLRNKK